METAGNKQLNESIENFQPINFVIPRNAKLEATYYEDLLNGVVEINGDVQYNDGGTLKDVKLQAIPYYAWNNRGDDGVQGQNSCSQMLIWTTATGDAEPEPEPQPTLDKIELSGDVKTKYQQGETLDLSKLVVTAIYSDKTTKEISAGEGGYSVSGYDAEKVGKQIVTIAYEGKTAEFEVTVEKKETTDPQEPQKPQEPQEPQKPQNPQNPANPAEGQSGNQNESAVKTGDVSNMVLPIMGLAMTAVLCFLVWRKKRTDR